MVWCFAKTRVRVPPITNEFFAGNKVSPPTNLILMLTSVPCA